MLMQYLSSYIMISLSLEEEPLETRPREREDFQEQRTGLTSKKNKVYLKE